MCVTRRGSGIGGSSARTAAAVANSCTNRSCRKANIRVLRSRKTPARGLSHEAEQVAAGHDQVTALGLPA
ncbi:hypothetical protein [Streptomyces mirabilis]|uniref:hypothetical protein n=1 Tax=Streptomyces mirabilis TaxID=68239 RepID=UPI0033173DAA